jgi:UDP-N-acetylmuramoyl-L-alanyl-D-glutamate--2,6-diaminopimelate ligase
VKLSELIRSLDNLIAGPAAEAEIHGIVEDSRQLHAGQLFVARRGDNFDAHRFIPDAVRRGAAAVVGELPAADLPGGAPPVPYYQVGDSRLALANLAAAWYGFPARRLTVIGVTGTDGKTTTANLIYQVLQAAGLRAGMISTVNALIGDRALDTGFHVTTPEAPSVQAYLAQMAAAGLTHVVLESTSHGLAQQRVAACEFDMAVVTNITHEHLDYHGDFLSYRAAKGRLFEMLAETRPKPGAPPRGAVLNADDLSYDYLSEITRVPQLSYGLSAAAQVRGLGLELRADGTRFRLQGRDLAGRHFEFKVETGLVGEFNAYNCLAAAALTRGVIGLPDSAVQRGLAAVGGVPGRMERIDLGQEFTALVDFAHTPNALRRALETARRLCDGQLIAVFGSAGLRDRSKRRMLAETSAEMADLTVLTAEDPRTESLAVILAEMADGARGRGGVEGKTFWRVPDRGDALRFAVRLAQPGDLVIAFGKGHEQSMCFGTTEYAWDDRTALRSALAERLGIPGPDMPYLPTAQAGL